MTDKEHAFGIESYKQIRTEVGVLLSRIENLFRYSLLATSTISAWLLTQGFGVTDQGCTYVKLPKQMLTLAWCIPPSFILLCGVIAIATHIRSRQMAGFLMECEESLGDVSLSWEHYLRTKPPLFTITTIIAWLLLLAAALYETKIGLSLAEFPVCNSYNKPFR